MQLTPAIHALRIPFAIPVRQGVTVDRFVYCYLIFGKGIILVDTGVKGSERTIFEYIRSVGRKPGEISGIFLTHAHPDHIGAARAIQEATRCEVSAHRLEAPWIEEPAVQERERPVPGFRNLVGGGVSVDHALSDGDSIPIEGAGTLEVLHTPGHSNGSLSFLLREEMALFCGDAVPLPGEIPIYEDAAAALHSLYRLKDLKDLRLLLSSWDVPRREAEVSRAFDEGIEWIEMIGSEIAGMVREQPDMSPREIALVLAGIIGIPETAVNPLMVRTIEGYLGRRGE